MKKNNLFLLIAVAVSVVHFAFLLHYFQPAISTPDAQGYFTQAKLLAGEGKSDLVPESILAYIGSHWNPVDGNRYYTTFPPGFSFLLSLPYKFAGAKSSLYLNPVLASLSLLGLFWLVRSWVGNGWAIVAMLLFGANPAANEHALFGDSHTSVIFFLIFGLAFLAHWLKKRSAFSIFWAGFCFGVIPSLRYAESVLLIAFALFLLLNFKRSKFYFMALVSAGAGAAFPVVALAVRNQIAFGAFWRTGYGVPKGPSHFGPDYFFQHFFPFIEKLFFDGLGILFITGLIGLIVLLVKKENRNIGLLFFLLIFPLTFLYMSYIWPPDPQSMRFLLPTFPVTIIATVWLLKIGTERYFVPGVVLTVVIVAVTIFTGLPRSFHSLQHLKSKNEVLVKITKVIEKTVRPGNLIISNEGILQNLDFLGKWRLIDFSLLIPRRQNRGFSVADRIEPERRIRNERMLHKYGNLSMPKRFAALLQDLQRWAKGRRITIIEKKRRIAGLEALLPAQDSLFVLKIIEIPDLTRIDFMAPGGRMRPGPGFRIPPGNNFGPPRLPNQIYDFTIDGEQLQLVEWRMGGIPVK